MRYFLAAVFIAAGGPAIAAQPTAEQKEMRAGLFRIVLARECQQFAGDGQLVDDAIAALKVTAEKNFPESAEEVGDKISTYMAGEGKNKPLAGLATPSTCKRLRDNIDAILRP